MAGFIKAFKIYIGFSDINRVHSTTDINAHYIGNSFINNCHRRTDSASFSCMYVRHNSYSAALSELIVAHATDLIDSRILNHSCIAYSCVNISLYIKHNRFLIYLFFSKKIPLTLKLKISGS